MKAERHRALDALRGLAAIAVANYHFLYIAADTPVQSMGTFTVYLFFTLSALSLAMVYGGDFASGITLADASRFYRARCARILPLLALVSAVGAALERTPEASAKGLLTATGAFALTPPGFSSIGLGAWSIGIEIGFYAIFPILALLLATVSTRNLMALTSCALVLQCVYLRLVASRLPAPVQHWEVYTVPLTFAPFFLFGFAIHRFNGVRSRFMLWPLLLSGACLAGYSLLIPGELFGDRWSYFALTGLAALTVCCAWRTDLSGALVPVATFLGEISYSLYLTHLLFLGAVMKAAELAGLALWQSWLLFSASSLMGAWLCYRLFERPLRRRFGSVVGT